MLDVINKKSLFIFEVPGLILFNRIMQSRINVVIIARRKFFSDSNICF